mgnify:CR=1 FL=1
MEATTKNEIEFNVSKALIIIEKDKDLNDMFREKYGTDYKMCHALINSGTGLKPSATAYVKALFVGIILEKKVLLDKYLALEDGEVVAEVVAEVEVAEVKEEKVKKTPNKKRWGVKAIASDVAEFFKGKAEQIHFTGNKVQDLKRVFTRLEQRMWNERFSKKTLTDEQLREISGAIETFNKKIESITNPKN